MHVRFVNAGFGHKYGSCGGVKGDLHKLQCQLCCQLKMVTQSLWHTAKCTQWSQVIPRFHMQCVSAVYNHTSRANAVPGWATSCRSCGANSAPLSRLPTIQRQRDLAQWRTLPPVAASVALVEWLSLRCWCTVHPWQAKAPAQITMVYFRDHT